MLSLISGINNQTKHTTIKIRWLSQGKETSEKNGRKDHFDNVIAFDGSKVTLYTDVEMYYGNYIALQYQ